MGAKEQIRAAVQQVTELRQQVRSQPALAQALREVKQLQLRRFAGTYADLLEMAPYQAAVQFFLAELYGDMDYAQRDTQFALIAAGLEHFFSPPLLAAAVSLAQLHHLTETLDLAMAQAWLADADPNEAARYLRAWRLLQHRPQRETQLRQVIELGRTLERLTRGPGLHLLLRMMRGPAALAGLGDLQQFLESGFDTFHAMAHQAGGANYFLATIEARESRFIALLFEGDSVACETQIKQALGQARGR